MFYLIAWELPSTYLKARPKRLLSGLYASAHVLIFTCILMCSIMFWQIQTVEGLLYLIVNCYLYVFSFLLLFQNLNYRLHLQ